MGKHYKHLSIEERTLIQTQLAHGCTLRAIARNVQRSASTITRELARNGWRSPAAKPKPGPVPIAGGYRCIQAQARATRLASKARVPRKLVVGNALWNIIEPHLCQRLSPEQICGTLARMKEPVRISHETIYKAIYAMPRGELRAQILAQMRLSRAKRRPRSAGKDRRGLIANMTSIDERPIEVDERLVPGHWEGDLIKGAFNRSQVGTLVERTTLFTVLVKVEQATAECTAKSFAQVMQGIDAQMRLSMTYDRGKEMAAHELFTQASGMQVYFAHPYSPWERGINENTNGLVREYLPKGEDLSRFTQSELDLIAFKLNTRPRKSLGWKCPLELFLPEGAFDFQAYWGSIGKPVALGA